MNRLKNTLDTMQATVVLMAINVIVFMVVFSKGGTVDALIQYGGLFAPTILYEQEYWRFFTSMFLHGDISHLFLNCYTLFILGKYLEPLFGKQTFLTIYLLGGLMGTVTSFAFNDFFTVSVGSSGAIFALFASLFVFNRIFPYHTGLRLVAGSFFWIFIVNIAFSFTPGTDYWAHIGGILGGTICALAIGFGRYNHKLMQILVSLVYIGTMLILFMIGK